MKRIIAFLCAAILCCVVAIPAFAHGGRTDSSGGHKDNQNVSGLGGYHYHCGGNPPHLHTNGVCPYSGGGSSSTSSSYSSSSGWDSDDDYVDWHDTFYYAGDDNYDGDFDGYWWEEEEKEIDVVGIDLYSTEGNTVKVGDTIKLKYDIFPLNASDQSVTWKVSNKNKASIQVGGYLTAKKPGTVTVSVTSENGYSDEIEIKVKRKIDMGSLGWVVAIVIFVVFGGHWAFSKK